MVSALSTISCCSPVSEVLPAMIGSYSAGLSVDRVGPYLDTG